MAEQWDGPGLHKLVGGLAELHERIREMAPLHALTRIAVAVYDAKTDLLRTFIHSSAGETPLNHYVAKLSDVPSLLEIAKSRKPRVVQDLAIYDTRTQHSRKVVDGGYRSSYTLPLLRNDEVAGFLFFNSTEKEFFTTAVLHHLWPYAQIASLITVMELDKIQVIQAAVNTVRQISRQRDEETGSHLDRMSRYTHLIAEGMAESHGLSDEFVEYLFQFAPLHDVGKVAIPDNILLKPGGLSSEEFAVMKTHVAKGQTIIEMMMADFGMVQVPHVEILRNVVAYHHEAWDGSGYPFGLKGEEIPLEARITAVADVFDALTSNRPYKTAWAIDKALDHMRNASGTKFFPPCVETLIANRDRIAEIQSLFAEELLD